jgi:hypothetical protein
MLCMLHDHILSLLSASKISKTTAVPLYISKLVAFRQSFRSITDKIYPAISRAVILLCKMEQLKF